ncbi:MAG: NUDIX domain-containing protein [Gammaproteobacteria bacterium]
MQYSWKLDKHQVLFSKYFRLEELSLSHELFEGGYSNIFTREIFERGSVVALLPYDPERRTVVLIEQFRAGAIGDEKTPWLLECVAGVIEEGESEEQVAIRESHEEAGCEVKKLHQISRYYVSPGGTTELCTLYCGIIDSEGIGGIHGLDHENEDIRVEVVDADSAYAMVRDGRIKSSATIIALQWLELNEQRLNS